MSAGGVARLEKIVRAVVTGAEGTPEPVTKMLAAELRTHPKLLLDALKDSATWDPNHATERRTRLNGRGGSCMRFCGPSDFMTDGPTSCRWRKGSSI